MVKINNYEPKKVKIDTNGYLQKDEIRRNTGKHIFPQGKKIGNLWSRSSTISTRRITSIFGNVWAHLISWKKKTRENVRKNSQMESFLHNAMICAYLTAKN